MRDCFNRLEDSSTYSASVLQTNVAKNTSSIARRGIESQMLYVSRGGESYLKVRGQTDSWMDYTINQLIKNMQ